MKVLILAGGRGTRIAEESEVRPKPMVEIGGMPIIWHIMKLYSYFGFHDFVILLGYKGYIIKEYFSNYFLHQNNVTIDLLSNKITYHGQECEPWTITLLDTGLDSLTGGRIKSAASHINNERFLLTYGDGLSNVNLNEVLKFHNSHGKAMTMTVVKPEGRYGALNIEKDNRISYFHEKPKGDGAWINGGFFVCESGVLDYIQGDTAFEQEPISRLTEENQLFAYPHKEFWHCMDTMRDKLILSELWDSGNAPWKLWD